jgi:hypothetical protein
MSRHTQVRLTLPASLARRLRTDCVHADCQGLYYGSLITRAVRGVLVSDLPLTACMYTLRHASSVIEG